MALKNEIQADLIESMKAKDEVRVSALRMLKAAILKFEVASGERKEASDSDILGLIQKEIKQRQDSVEQFQKGNRFDMAEKEEKEMAVLKGYMPPQMTEEEVLELAKAAVEQSGAKGKGEIGKVMAILMPQVKGKADGSIVNRIVSQLL